MASEKSLEGRWRLWCIWRGLDLENLIAVMWKSLFFGLISVIGARAQGTTQTALPYGLESRNGTANDYIFSGRGERQEWFRGSYLAQAWQTPVLITEVAFRLTERAFSARDYTATVPHIELWMTTTSQSGATLSSWQLNAGPDAQRVFAADSLALFSPGGPGPNPFGLSFSFDQPFVHNPQQGNLLMRIITGGDGTEYPGSEF